MISIIINLQSGPRKPEIFNIGENYFNIFCFPGPTVYIIIIKTNY